MHCFITFRYTVHTAFSPYVTLIKCMNGYCNVKSNINLFFKNYSWVSDTGQHSAFPLLTYIM